MVVLSDLHNSEFGAYNSELVDKVRQHWPAFTCASRWAMWKPDCAPTIWIPPIRRSSTGRRWACWQNTTSRPPSRPNRTCCGSGSAGGRHREHFQRGTLHDPTAVRGQGPEQGRSGSAEENPRRAVRHPSGMMFCGAVPRNAGVSGDAAVRFVLLTFHHRRVVPSGAVKIRFQSKGFSLVEFSCTGRAFGAAGAQGAKSWARMPTAVQVSGTSAAR